jgi:Xaa-Pro aminopeptidase
MSSEEALRISGVDSVISAKEGESLLRRLAKQHSVVYTIPDPHYAEHFNFVLNPALKKNWRRLERMFQHVQDCTKDIAALRALKQPDELAMIKKAVDVSAAAFKRIHENFSNYKNEYEIEADFAREVRFSGASGCAYDSIVASGSNACTLHYHKNTSPLRSRQMALLDMGARYGGYAADISRTYVKGEPTKRQREVHQAVETGHHRIINLLKPNLSVYEYQNSVDTIMTEALKSIGLPHDNTSLRKYFPHAISHGLGIDVHDSLAGPKYFEENMVLTVEPGIYIPEEGIGVRIEDDILIMRTGHKNLSANLSTGL